MSDIQEFLKGKKTHLLVMASIGVLALLDLDTPDGVDLETLQKALFTSMISTGKAALDRWAAK